MESYRDNGLCGAIGGRLSSGTATSLCLRIDSSARQSSTQDVSVGCHGKRALTSAGALIFFRQLHAMRGRREPDREGTIRRPLRRAARR